MATWTAEVESHRKKQLLTKFSLSIETHNKTELINTLVLFEAMISIAGGRFRGVQKGFRDGYGRPIEPLILFDDATPGSDGSTLALPASEMSVFAVIKALREKRQQFESGPALMRPIMYLPKVKDNVWGTYGLISA